MGDFGTAIVIALGLILIIEGAAYALFPDAMRRMLATALTLPVARLRTIGTGAALAGLLIVWLAY